MAFAHHYTSSVRLQAVITGPRLVSAVVAATCPLGGQMTRCVQRPPSIIPTSHARSVRTAPGGTVIYRIMLAYNLLLQLVHLLLHCSQACLRICRRLSRFTEEIV